ncbi:MAG: LysM peptidoglycan-binding domain-containing protein [Limnochordaceae bacterium]|nr:LysM peptidoglycan-binding domain-containing protein [Limnochordaceae bacterium]
MASSFEFGLQQAPPPPPPSCPGGRVVTIQPGDTLWVLANRYGTTLAAIRAANPQITDPNRLQVGQRVCIPAAGAAPGPAPAPPPRVMPLPANLATPPSPSYDHEQMAAELRWLAGRYPFLQLTSIGNSVEGRPLMLMRFGRGGRLVHLNGAHHANEWITSPLLVRFMAAFARAYESGGAIGGFSAATLFEQAQFWIVPMVNPDGVNLVQHGIAAGSPYYNLVMQANGWSRDFRRWKANIRGVDLNRNYPAYWERARLDSPPGPSYEGYVGPAPLSEPETANMATLTRSHPFRLVCAYHTAGGVIYWNFLGLAPAESARIATEMAARSGYTPIGEAPPEALYGGYKDWFILAFRRPGFTVEVGSGPSPVPVWQFSDIYYRNIPLIAYLGTV